MSNYEHPDFNPLDPNEAMFDIMHESTKKAAFHIVDPQVLCAKALTETVLLIDATMPSSGDGERITASYSTGINGDGVDARYLDGAIDVKRFALGINRFRHHFDVSSQSSGGAISKYDEQHPAHRIVKSTGYYYPPMVASISDDHQDRIILANHGRIPLQDHRKMPIPSMYRVLEAVAVDNTVPEFTPERQVVDYIRVLLSVAEIAHNIGSFAIPKPLYMDDLVITPNGPLYRNPDSGQYMHSLEREVVTLAAEASVTSEQPAEANNYRSVAPASNGPARRRYRERPSSGPEPAATWESPSTTFDDLYGIDHIKDELTGLVAWFKAPEVAKKWRAKRPAGVLLHGPAGTGKTSLVHALADAVGGRVRKVDASQIYKPVIGEAEAAMKQIFDEIRKADKPLVVFFDEFDGIVATASERKGAYRTTNAIAGLFKTETEAISRQNPNIIFAAATNDLDRIDPALIRAGRFDIKLQVGLPNDESRRQILSGIISSEQMLDFNADQLLDDSESAFQRFAPDVLDGDALDIFANVTEGMSGADIRTLVDSALLRKMQAELRGESVSPVSRQDFLAEVTRYLRR
jgi:DNA polymerase III delta prime subunit